MGEKLDQRTPFSSSSNSQNGGKATLSVALTGGHGFDRERTGQGIAIGCGIVLALVLALALVFAIDSCP